MLVVLATVGPFLPLGDPRAIGIGPRLAAPTPEWPLGTDTLGRSLLPRVVEAIRNTILLALIAVAITLVISIIVGILAGYLRGAFDVAVVRVADSLFAFPSILLAILVSAIVGPGSGGAIASIALVTMPLMTRVVRAATLSVAD